MNENIQELSRFEQLVKTHELSSKVAEQLHTVLSTCEIVVLCDDSGSMGSTITEENIDPFASNTIQMTRWMELKKLVATVITFCTAINPNGVDLYFLNRNKCVGVNSIVGLQNIFSAPPSGDTQITKTLNQIYEDKQSILSQSQKQLLIIVVTDGEPTDGTNDARSNLFRAIRNITKNSRIHISFAECTDQEDDMAYLDGWDNQLRNFDNTDDYREELKRVKRVNGPNFKFDYTDYVIKILLATFIKSYFNLDQVSQTNNNNYNNNYNNNNNDDCDCCIVL